MKKVMIAFIAILTVFLSSAGIAASMDSTAPDTHKVAPVETKILVRPDAMKVDVFVGAFEKPGLAIRLRNERGKVLAVKRIAKSDEQTGVRFDVSQLNDGYYHVEIRHGKHTQRFTMELKTFVPEPSFQRVLSIKEDTL